MIQKQHCTLMKHMAVYLLDLIMVVCKLILLMKTYQEDYKLTLRIEV